MARNKPARRELAPELKWTGGAAGNSAGGAQGGKPGDVIDAEYVDVDENKRPN